jgi:dipeptidase E
MKTLLLTSAGMRVKDEILKLLPKSPEDTRVAHIITASKAEEDTSYLLDDVKIMEDVGLQVTNMDIEGKSEDELRALLEDMDVIYVQGGNSYYLLKYVRESGFDRVVKDLIDEGKLYVGVSAGSIIAGPTIETAGWKEDDRNTVGLENLAGLNLVPFLVYVHYDEMWEDVVHDESVNSEYPVRILTDGQAFLVQGDEVTLVGEGEEVQI